MRVFSKLIYSLSLFLSIFSNNSFSQDKAIELLVAKTPTCGCCTLWLDHLTSQNIKVEGKNFSHPQMSEIKSQYGIEARYRSCHTAVHADGFAFEGHVPAKFIKQFLQSPPNNAIGLSVPAMPLGSPGMEIDERFQAYKVLLLKKDGSYEVFAEVNSYKEQF
ncbi:DUF411 domain-containing protein [Pseudoalteromonas phenolica]|uniref:Metal-binding protein n=1 Tax=Pseudoalteromonas phenolica TaxID=161398 RepID=A0A0S2K817_9GAMM|nr:DUF411 domain-containing protein [Pseudoalteromonas phenolica]ALO44528.1 Metal-binding protein [Pseudoalteromonas phenolica]MBE0357555.1 hypothetical protein [Pseudoalteromonas phenolica O-BC30]RXE98448.1 DUF411 domain-containing protein [Pseudoalteromonas phenolica O-BC30]